MDDALFAGRRSVERRRDSELYEPRKIVTSFISFVFSGGITES